MNYEDDVKTLSKKGSYLASDEQNWVQHKSLQQLYHFLELNSIHRRLGLAVLIPPDSTQLSFRMEIGGEKC